MPIILIRPGRDAAMRNSLSQIGYLFEAVIPPGREWRGWRKVRNQRHFRQFVRHEFVLGYMRRHEPPY
jgi:hypothetical protein